MRNLRGIVYEQGAVERFSNLRQCTFNVHSASLLKCIQSWNVSVQKSI